MVQQAQYRVLPAGVTCMATTCEKTASGTASRMERSQMDTAFKHVQKTALEVWMSIGLTMALYLEKEKKNEEKEEKEEMMQKMERKERTEGGEEGEGCCVTVPRHALPPTTSRGRCCASLITVSWDDSASPAANCC